MAGDSPGQKADWFEEFKKANAASSSAPSSTPTPGSASKPNERRRHHRFEVDECQATLYREGLLSAFGVRRDNRARAALDLSEGGARFLTHERIPIGTKVRMLIQMEKYKDTIQASGEVRWCYQSAKKPQDFYAGVQFTDLDPAQIRKITLMRDWFTSPQYRAVKETKRKKAGSGGDDLAFPP